MRQRVPWWMQESLALQTRTKAENAVCCVSVEQNISWDFSCVGVPEPVCCVDGRGWDDCDVSNMHVRFQLHAGSASCFSSALDGFGCFDHDVLSLSAGT